MKKIRPTKIAVFSAFAICSVLASCVSSPKPEDNSGNEITITEDEPQGKVIREPKALTVQNTASEKEAQFKSLLETIEIKIVSTPANRTVYTGQPFPSPYIVSVSDHNGPVKDFGITVSWPVSRNGDTIIYSTAQMQTDSSGRISFIPGIPSIAVNDTIAFYPTPVTSSASVVQASYASAATSPYKVKSKYMQYPGGILFVYDYNEKGNPTTNNFALLQKLRNEGVNAGNAPVSDTSYLIRPAEDVYKACISITQGEIKRATNFLVVGSFRWAKPAEENADGTTVTLTADVTCLDMSDGSVKYKTKITESATDKTKWNAETSCRSVLAEKVAEKIIYGM